MDLAWFLLRANSEFKRDLQQEREKPGSFHFDYFVVGDMKLIKCKVQNENLREKWGILNLPNQHDLTGGEIFWDPVISINSLNAKTSKGKGVSLSRILCLPHIRVTGAIFEHSGTCLIKITYEFQFYQLVFESIDDLEMGMTIQLSIPMGEDFLQKKKTASSLWELCMSRGSVSERMKAANENMQIAKLIEEGASHKEIAQKLYGVESVRNNWGADGWMRTRTRYNIKKTKALIQGGYRALL